MDFAMPWIKLVIFPGVSLILSIKGRGSTPSAGDSTRSATSCAASDSPLMVVIALTRSTSPSWRIVDSFSKSRSTFSSRALSSSSSSDCRQYAFIQSLIVFFSKVSWLFNSAPKH
uniref:Secreted protein n=1 Tax=Setaria viridis TaxID=4556 RepID=A0A4U6TF37_SETVI|nr:hypothetical protein SEVIR_8G139566v2 [Setaria viridis]